MGLCPPTRSEYEAPAGERAEVVRVWLLGGFRVSVGSRVIEDKRWRLEKAATLVKLLALSPGHRLHREQAMDHLWPDLGKKAVSNNLRQAVYAARRILARDRWMSARYLASEEESLVLCPGGQLWVDFEAEEAATARRSRDPTAPGRRWICTRANFCPMTATRSGRTTGGSSCAESISSCWSNLPDSTKNAASTRRQSRFVEGW